ncbi:MAG TPA: hypothetical protein VNW47_11400 [Terriglobales bacterium]|jgi:hypothetical protein|nr:hypothetical protein [Terriglobales bacterium]
MSSIATANCIADAVAPISVLAGHRSHFAVAGITVEVRGEDPQSADLGPQLAQFARLAMTGELSDIVVQVEWARRLEAIRKNKMFDSGCVWSVHEFGDGFQFDFETERFGKRPYKRLLVDAEFQHARVLLNQECLTANDASRALEYPLDELLITHHLSLGRGVELHGCGLVREDGESFLFVGHSGAGKSTTARLWAQHAEVEVLSDDRIIVRRDCVGRTLTVARTLLSAALDSDLCRQQTNVKGRGQERPRYNQENRQFIMHGTPWHGEAAFASPGRAPLRRIFLLEHGRENRIEPLSRSAAVGELLARSFTPFYQSRFVDPVLALLEELVDAVPCYRFHFVPDQTAVETILAFHD